MQTCPIGDRDRELNDDVGQGERAFGHGRQQLGCVGERKHGSLRFWLTLGAGGRSALGSGVEAPNLNERLLVVAPELLQRGHGITFEEGSGRAAQRRGGCWLGGSPLAGAAAQSAIMRRI